MSSCEKATSLLRQSGLIVFASTIGGFRIVTPCPARCSPTCIRTRDAACGGGSETETSQPHGKDDHKMAQDHSQKANDASGKAHESSKSPSA